MNKVVFITGGSSGIGKSIGDYLHFREYTVIGTSRNPDRYPDSNFELVAMQVQAPESIQAAVAHTIQKHGKIDVLVNNAGVGITGPIEETPDAQVHNAFNTNVYGPIRVINTVMPHMREASSGLIINITSIAGYMGLPYRGIYSASKAALGVITEAMRMEIREFGVQMTTIAPGDFATNIAAGRYHAPVLEDSAYKENYAKSIAIMDEHVAHGNDPKEMAKAVYNIIQKKKPKVHYREGAFIQKFSIVLKRLLPDTWYEKLLRSHYKL
ncbi:MAG: SDR family oxidoreductase [Gilvibacter sp.]